MTPPLLPTPPVSQNSRVKAFTIGGDESPRRLPLSLGRNASGTDELIEQAYRQIFFHAFKVDRDASLESQLRSGQITVRDFIRGLLLSSKFRNDFYRCNSNYRVVDQLVGRVLGRPVYGDKERIALSILIGEKGLGALVDNLLDSAEYNEHFGLDTVPYQRSRVLAGRSMGSMPFNQQAPRYDDYWRTMNDLRAPAGWGTATSGTGFSRSMPRPKWLADAPSPLARKIWQGLVTAGGFALTGFLLYTAAAMLSTAGGG